MKNNHKLVIGLLSSTLLLSQTAFAAPYISAQAGVYGLGENNPIKNIFDNEDDIDLGATGRLSAGYLWDINNCLKLGAEAGFTAYQQVELAENDFFSVKAKRWSGDVLAVADFYATQNLDLFAKAGGAYVKQSYPINFLGFQDTVSDKKVVPKGVVGVGYNLNPDLNLNFSLNHEFKKENSDTFIPGASSALVGLRYSFS